MICNLWDVISLTVSFCVLTSMGSSSPNGNPCTNKSQIIVEREYCKPWHYTIEGNNDCMYMGNKLHGIIRRKDPPQLQLGYCMTEDNGTTYVIACPYDLYKRHVNFFTKKQAISMNTTLKGLNNFTCSQLNRKGQHCHKCIDHHGQSIYTLDLSCYSCSAKYSGWLVYLALEIGSLNFLFGFIVICNLILRISPTKPNMKSFVLFSQLTTMFLSLASETPYVTTFGSSSSYFIKIIKTCYGIWNLDLFRSTIPSFCVDEDLNNLMVVSFQYLSIIYPTILLAFVWAIVDLHERGFKVVVIAWSPARRFLSHYPVVTDPKRTIVNTFATFVVLSYTKVIYISAQILNLVREYQFCSYREKLYLQPDIHYFSRQHIPFVFLSTIMLFLFVVLPIMFLILYPIETFQNKLNSFCIRSRNIQLFVEAFYGCYTDGTNDTNDRRLFSTVYLLFRIIVVLVFVKASTIAAYIVLALCHGVVFGMVCLFKPYKQSSYHYLDSFFLVGFGVSSLLSAVATTNPEPSLSKFIFSVIYIIMASPLLYASICVLRVLIKWFRLIDIKSIIHRRRRGYAEIIAYATESIKETDQPAAKWNGQGDSDQSTTQQNRP